MSQGQKFVLSKEQQSELKEAFEVFDVNGDGNIDADELGMILEAVGRKMTLEQVQDAIAKIDSSGDGEIGYDEFLQLMTEEMKE